MLPPARGKCKPCRSAASMAYTSDLGAENWWIWEALPPINSTKRRDRSTLRPRLFIPYSLPAQQWLQGAGAGQAGLGPVVIDLPALIVGKGIGDGPAIMA